MCNKVIYLFITVYLFAVHLSAEVADLIVAQDSSGDYTTIQEALDAAPFGAQEHFIILIKKGTYNEKIFIEKDFLALVGEDRDSTVIVISLLRDDWLAENPGNDWGAATVNISNSAEDLLMANLTVKNNYADLNPDDPNKRAHCFAVRGGGNRVITVNCNFITGGGDTFSLWNHGYYYHKDCYFEGGVDYVCPRGWCYITDCQFYGYNTGASVWHDGREDPDEKLVIRNSFFDGVQNFGLGRHHVDAQFYFLNCLLTDNVNDNGGIQKAGSDPLYYGERNYYYETHRESGDFDWHLDNLWEAAKLPGPDEITSLWTFRGEWDPEETMPPVLPWAYMPKPNENQKKTELNPILRWIAGRNALSHDVYFGTSNPPAFAENTNEMTYDPGSLTANTTYYWRVDEVTDDGKIEGEVWSFTTRQEIAPQKASNPYPADGATELQAPINKMTWDMDVSIADTAKLYMGNHPDSLQLVHTYSIGGYKPEPFVLGKTYYWRVDLSNPYGQATGDIWQFSMEKSYYNFADYYQTNDEQGLIVIEAENFTDSSNIADHYWGLVTDPGDYSGSGAMQALPDDGTFFNTGYLEKCSRLDYAVDFIKTNTHYIWVRAYAPDVSANTVHMGINFNESENARRIGNFTEYGQWQWLNADLRETYLASVEVNAIGTQGLHLWFGKDGIIVDKIVITTDPDYIPTGLGPDATVGIEKEDRKTSPQGFRLYQNFPNPFNPDTKIRFELARAGHVELAIYDSLGRKVADLVKGFKKAGSYTVNWNALNNKGNKLAGGVYYARLKTDSYKESIKLLFLP